MSHRMLQALQFLVSVDFTNNLCHCRSLMRTNERTMVMGLQLIHGALTTSISRIGAGMYKLQWKQIIIPTLHSYMHPNIRIGITKSISIQEDIGMKTKFLFSFLIPIYQTWLQGNGMFTYLKYLVLATCPMVTVWFGLRMV